MNVYVIVDIMDGELIDVFADFADANAELKRLQPIYDGNGVRLQVVVWHVRGTGALNGEA